MQAILENSYVFLVDADNLFFGARNQQEHPHENPRIDFKMLKEAALDGRQFASMYCKVYASMRTEKPDVFALMLKRFGFFSKLDIATASSQPRDMDVSIAVDAVTYRVENKLPEVVAIGSGDADFLPVYNFLKCQGVRVEVVSFPRCLAKDVASTVDRVIALDSRVTFNEGLTEGAAAD